MDLAVDDNSYRSAQAASSFTSLLQSELAAEPGIEWLERAQLDLARKELDLSDLEGLSGSPGIRSGQLVKADWLANGKFSLDDQGRRTLLVEITDLAHADVMASETLTLPGEATTPMQLEQSHVQAAVPMFQRLFRQARQRAEQAERQVIIAPLFFADLRQFLYQMDFKEEFAPLNAAFYDRIEEIERTNSQIRLIRFPKAYLAMGESEMILDGLVESGMSSWENMADLYVWGTYSNVSFSTPSRTNAHTMATETRHQLSLHVWDGVSAPFTYEVEYRHAGRERITVEESKEFWARLENEISKRAVKRKVEERRAEARQKVADSMVKLFRSVNATGPFPGGNRSKFIGSVRLIEAACFLAPDNAEAQLLRMIWRWGNWMDFQPSIKNEFWSKWRRSNAWGKYVESFGFVGSGVRMPLFDGRREIARTYVNSLAGVLEMFPRAIESDEQMKDEWSQTRQAQRHGFPKDIPGERIAEWKAQVTAELAERKRKAEAYLKTLGETNAFPHVLPPPVKATPPTYAMLPPATNFPPRVITPSIGRTNVRPMMPQRKAQTPPATGPQTMVHPVAPKNTNGMLRLTGLGQTRALFQLHAPSVWPTEISTTNKHEIVFPAHFEAKTIVKMVPWEGQLVTLVVDERSRPTSDLEAEISEELLTRAGRLWLVKEGAHPQLLEAEGMPESVHAFLIENDRLWVAGQNFGYLDLRDRRYHVCQKGEGPEGPEDQVVTCLDGKLYTLQHLGVRSFDPSSSTWHELPRPSRIPVYSSGRQVLLAAADRWLCYSGGAPGFYNIGTGQWRIVSSIYMAESLCSEGPGFWIGGWNGLQFYEPERDRLENWHPPVYFGGLRIFARPLDLKTLAQDQGSLSSYGEMPAIFRKAVAATNEMARYAPPRREPFRLDSHIPGTVRGIVKDGERLWLAVADGVALLDLPSRSLISSCRFGLPVACIGVLNDDIYLGLAYDRQLLVRVAKRDFYDLPKSAWKPLSISAEERNQLIAEMSPRDKAVYDFYAGDTAGVVKVLETLTPGNETNVELMVLAAFANGPSGTDNPPLARAWCERIIALYPETPWSKFAQKEMEDAEQKHKTRQHQDWLLARFDRNHDGVIDDEEKKAMGESPEFQREERSYRQDVLLPQIQALLRRFDHNQDGKLSRGELETVKSAVNLVIESPTGRLERQRALLTPVLTKNFPAVEKLLRKYDANKDGALDAAELTTFAKDLQR